MERSGPQTWRPGLQYEEIRHSWFDDDGAPTLYTSQEVVAYQDGSFGRVLGRHAKEWRDPWDGRHKIVIGGEIEDEVDGANAAQPMDLEGPMAVAGRHSEG